MIEMNILSENSQYDGYIEIRQDAAGVVETGQDRIKGFFTEGIQTCSVIVFICKKATILIHDSSQLKLSHITSLIKKHGTIRKIITIQGENADSKHDARLKEILNVAGVGIKINSEIVPHNTFALKVDISGVYQIVLGKLPDGIHRIPDLAKRQAICELNNFFHPNNAQSLWLDIQFQNGKYSEIRKLDMSLNELLQTLKTQPKFFFQNIVVLNNGHKQKIFELPPYLLELVEKYSLDKLEELTPDCLNQVVEAHEFKKYIDTFR